ncbi:hypothetical protein CYMTET_34401 [Cymbomonas tetramitiformis]|uniref:Zinc finger PHD-type domain-containing protein n=1 Tax=Cymbomonas tetramitiformis TaxID=36881 RepID=A0AAE0FB66_9CHLO|nr:hypothetical protein CYMTET_34401 [Cymbomonas tetramitiformis]
MVFEHALVYISLFATARSYRYRKLGSLLMAWLKRACVDRDLRFVVMGALRRAAPIWKHLGFQGPHVPVSQSELRTYMLPRGYTGTAATHIEHEGRHENGHQVASKRQCLTRAAPDGSVSTSWVTRHKRSRVAEGMREATGTADDLEGNDGAHVSRPGKRCAVEHAFLATEASRGTAARPDPSTPQRASGAIANHSRICGFCRGGEDPQYGAMQEVDGHTVHELCALWSPACHESDGGELRGVAKGVGFGGTIGATAWEDVKVYVAVIAAECQLDQAVFGLRCPKHAVPALPALPALQSVASTTDADTCRERLAGATVHAAGARSAGRLEVAMGGPEAAAPEDTRAAQAESTARKEIQDDGSAQPADGTVDAGARNRLAQDAVRTATRRVFRVRQVDSTAGGVEPARTRTSRAHRSPRGSDEPRGVVDVPNVARQCNDAVESCGNVAVRRDVPRIERGAEAEVKPDTAQTASQEPGVGMQVEQGLKNRVAEAAATRGSEGLRGAAFVEARIRNAVVQMATDDALDACDAMQNVMLRPSAPGTIVKMSFAGEGGEEHLEGHQHVSFKAAVPEITALQRRGGVEPRIGERYSRDTYTFITNDIVMCKAGVEADGTRSSDAWWPAIIREPLHKSKQRPLCEVKIFWCDHSPHSKRAYQINSTPVVVRYRALLKDKDGKPMFIPVEETSGSSTFNDGMLTYEFASQFCDLADELAALWDGGNAGLVGADEGSDEDGDLDGGAMVLPRQSAQEVVKTVMSTTASGREARHTRDYTDYRQMNSGSIAMRRAPKKRERRVGKEGNYETCCKCGQLGDLMCDFCMESYHLECIGSIEVPEGDWRCPACEAIP